jgi:hypothetical protein
VRGSTPRRPRCHPRRRRARRPPRDAAVALQHVCTNGHGGGGAEEGDGQHGAMQQPTGADK